jgi:hypothetical protein
MLPVIHCRELHQAASCASAMHLLKGIRALRFPEVTIFVPCQHHKSTAKL